MGKVVEGFLIRGVGGILRLVGFFSGDGGMTSSLLRLFSIVWLYSWVYISRGVFFLVGLVDF